MRCAVLDDYQRVARSYADWSGLGLDLTVYDTHFTDEDALVRAIGECTIVVAMRERTPFQRPLFERLPNLRLLVTTAMRNPAIDLRAAESLGVIVCGTDALPYPTAELTWGLILALTRHIPQEHAAIRAGGSWHTRVGVDLHGKTLGLVGLGTLGQRVARVGRAFDMKVIAWSNNLTAEAAAAHGVEYVSKDALIERADVLSIHTQLSRRTEGLIGRAELRRMKPSAYLVNTSRGFIVDEQALIEALRDGWIAGAGLDVYETEPLPPHSPLRSLPNVVLTPHVGYVSEDNYRIWWRQIVENIAAWQAGRVLRRLDPARNVDRSL